MRSQLSGLLPTNMGEELPREGPPSLGALYQPVWALSQKGVGGGFCLDTLYIYISIDIYPYLSIYIHIYPYL